MVESDLYIESNTACSNLVRDATNVGVMLGHWPRGLQPCVPIISLYRFVVKDFFRRRQWTDYERTMAAMKSIEF